MRRLFEQYPDQIAGLIVEPIAANMGFVLPAPGFLQSLQDVCRDFGALFILDEVMTGFRVAPGSAQAFWNLDPDLTCLGKVIGGGLPVGAYAGKQEIMKLIAPSGSVYQAGTLSGNPLAMTAGLATIRTLLQPGIFDAIAQTTAELVQGIQAAHAGTMFGLYFLKETGVTITDYASAKTHADTACYGRFFHALLDQGVYFAPSQFEAGFVSSAHSAADIQATCAAARTSFEMLAIGKG